MDNKFFSLGSTENSKVINIIRIAFGLICIAVAIFWISFNISQLKTDRTLWITIFFLTGFGLYQVWSGFGMASLFVEIGTDFIRIRKNAILPPVKMYVSQIKKIEIFPLNLIFRLTKGKKLLLRFGTTFQDTNELVKDEIIKFAELNQIAVEFMEENM